MTDSDHSSGQAPTTTRRQRLVEGAKRGIGPGMLGGGLAGGVAVPLVITVSSGLPFDDAIDEAILWGPLIAVVGAMFGSLAGLIIGPLFGLAVVIATFRGVRFAAVRLGGTVVMFVVGGVLGMAWRSGQGSWSLHQVVAPALCGGLTCAIVTALVAPCVQDPETRRRSRLQEPTTEGDRWA